MLQELAWRAVAELDSGCVAAGGLLQRPPEMESLYPRIEVALIMSTKDVVCDTILTTEAPIGTLILWIIFADPPFVKVYRVGRDCLLIILERWYGYGDFVWPMTSPGLPTEIWEPSSVVPFQPVEASSHLYLLHVYSLKWAYSLK